MQKKDFQNWPREKLLHEYKELLKRKKFGIVWENKPEDAAEQCKVSLPVLKDEKKKAISIDKDGTNHIFIEGDNYHSLSVLNYTHQRKIDVIYIDPPYNTGNKDFKYNDKFVDEDDSYRHSKWLSFMKKRLYLAKNLLTNTGVIFISLDDNEQAQLKLLCDEIFGEKNFIETIIWKKRATPPNDRPIGRIHEYIHVYSRASTYYLGLLPRDEKSVKRYSNPDNDPKGDWVASDLSASGKGGRLVKGCIYPILNKGKSYMPPEGKCWLFNKEKMGLFIREGRIGFRKNSGAPFLKRYLSEVRRGITMPSILSEHGFSFHSAKEIDELFGKKGIFEHPKPLKLIETLLQLATKKNSIVLDFFAGSGTTGQAVLELNKKDKGARQFILCTDNQDNNGTGTKIASDICYPRVKNVMVGYSVNGKKINGLGGNLRYYSTELVGNVKTDHDKRVLTSRSTEMLCLAEGTFDEVMVRKGAFALYQNDKQMTGIIYDEDAIEDFKKEARKQKKPFVVYVFSYDHTYNEEDFEDLDNLKTVKPIPEVILNIYRKIYKELYKPRHL